MRKLIYFKVAGKDVHMPKLIGAFVLIGALLMFINSTAVMFNSWDNVKYLGTCLDKANPSSLADFNDCRETLYKSTGAYLQQGQGKLTSTQVAGVLLGPIANVLFWAAGLFIGYIIYRTGDLVVPIEETISTGAVRRVGKKKKRR